MKKTLKVLGIAAGVVAVAAVVLAILIRIWFPPEKIKALAVSYVSETTHRKVSVGEASIGLFTGFVIRDVAITERDGKTPFLKCRAFVFRYDLWALLGRKLVIEKLVIEAPEPSGSSSFDEKTSRWFRFESEKP